MKLKKINDIFHLLFIATNLFFAASIKAEPVVIKITGITYPIASYLQALSVMPAQLSVNQDTVSIHQPQAVSFLPQQIATPSMTSGKVLKQEINLPYLTQPIFMVGSDSRSEQWLKQYHARLSELSAIGFLVQANDAADIKRMQNLIPNLVLLPLSGEAVSQQLGLHHYPALISKHLVEQ